MVNVATNANFADILASHPVVLVDFWAAWCGPCRMLSPTVDDIASELGDRVYVVKCNVDDCPDIASQYGIRSIPTLLYFKGGEVSDRTVGVVSKDTIIEKINALA